MPLHSKKQRRFLWANDPELARKFEDETPKGARLPEEAEKKKKGAKGDLRAWAERRARN